MIRQTRIGTYRIQSEHEGAGPPVVLLHGLSGSHRWWRFTTPVLSRRHAVHVPELVGFGGSRGVRGQPDIPAMAAVMTEWLRRNDLAECVLVGHSMGGQVALHIAAEHLMPQGLVLVCSSGLPRTWSLRDATQIVAGVLPPRAWGSKAFVPTIAADAVRAGPRALMYATRHLLSDDVTPLLPRITCPTLVIWGELDPLVPIEHGRRLAAQIAGARFFVIRNAAHNPMADRPTEFNQVLLDFLDA